MASSQDLALDRNYRDPRAQWLLDHEYTMSNSVGIVITDDFNPMESVQARKSEIYRKVFMERITPELLLL